MYKDGDASNQTAYVAPAAGKVEFTSFGSMDVTFDAQQTYIIVPKGVVNETYSLVLSGDVATYDVNTDPVTHSTSTLNSDISVGSKTY